MTLRPTSPDRHAALPNFLVIGAMKAGTTSLYQYLRAHPDIFMASPKELHFFSARHAMDLDWYRARFADAGAAAAIGEASASYTTYPDSDAVPDRIAEVIPDARLIYLIRHPIDRMRSHYLHRVGAGKETSDIDRALVDDPIYLRTSRYAERLEPYLRRFPRERVLILRSEDLLSAREASMRRIFGFLGVDASLMPDVASEFYRTSGKRVPRRGAQVLRRSELARRLIRRMPAGAVRWGRRISTETIRSSEGAIGPELYAKLEAMLRDDVARLRDVVGDGFDGWGIV